MDRVRKRNCCESISTDEKPARTAVRTSLAMSRLSWRRIDPCSWLSAEVRSTAPNH